MFCIINKLDVAYPYFILLLLTSFRNKPKSKEPNWYEED